MSTSTKVSSPLYSQHKVGAAMLAVGISCLAARLGWSSWCFYARASSSSSKRRVVEYKCDLVACPTTLELNELIAHDYIYLNSRILARTVPYPLEQQYLKLLEALPAAENVYQLAKLLQNNAGEYVKMLQALVRELKWYSPLLDETNLLAKYIEIEKLALRDGNEYAKKFLTSYCTLKSDFAEAVGNVYNQLRKTV
jgi:hypothetical protein